MSMWMIFRVTTPSPPEILEPVSTHQAPPTSPPSPTELQHDRERKFGLAMAVLCGFCWAILAIGLKVALGFATSGTIAWFRLAAAFLFLALFVAARNPKDLVILRRLPYLGVIAALGLAVNYFGFMKGVELTSPSNAQVFIQLAPLLLIVVGVVFFRERPSRIQVLGFILTFVGFALFYKDQLDHVLNEVDRFRDGNLWILGAAVTWTLFAALQKVLLKTWTPEQINLLLYGLCALLLTPLAQWSDFIGMSPLRWGLMVGLALNTVIAYGALGVALQKAPASQVSVIITVNPLLTLAIMALLGALQVTWIEIDRVDPLGWIGALIVVIGVILAVRRKS